MAISQSKLSRPVLRWELGATKPRREAAGFTCEPGEAKEKDSFVPGREGVALACCNRFQVGSWKWC
mgnify:CR=1 FL=1